MGGAILALVLGGCVPDPASRTAAEDKAAGSAQSSPAAGVTSPAAAKPVTASIPDSLRGRWGLVPADCTSQRGDAKGLLIIYPDQLRFYESTAKLGETIKQAPDSIRANFAFTGEGSTWRREMILEVQDNGQRLMRREFGPEAMAEPLRYTRCN